MVKCLNIHNLLKICIRLMQYPGGQWGLALAPSLSDLGGPAQSVLLQMSNVMVGSHN